MRRKDTQEHEQNPFTITPIHSFQELKRQLLQQGTDKEVFNEKRVLHSLSTLCFITEKIGKHVYVLSSPNGVWCVVADNIEQIHSHEDQLRDVDIFQETIEPENLWGQCIYVHEYAAVDTLADGIASKHIEEQPGPAIYKGAIHVLSYKDHVPTNTSIYFDLTAKVYMFARHGKAGNALANGLIVFDTLGSTQNIEALYNAEWQRESRENIRYLSPLDYYIKKFRKKIENCLDNKS